MKVSFRSVFIIANICFVPVASAQQSATHLSDNNVPIIRAESRLVNVPVNVTDEHGVAVAGLSIEDFVVKEDGNVQKVAIFERQSTSPLSMVMAIDTSESVLTQFNTERDAAKGFIKNVLREQDEMDLMSFADNVTEVVPFTNNASRISSGLSHLERGDATSLYGAVYLASQLLTDARKDATRRRVLILITDGGDTTKGMRYQQAVEEAQKSGTAIYPIIVMPILSDAGRNVAGEHALIQMAEDTGGKFFYVRGKGDLNRAFAHLSDDLRTQYLIAYYAAQHPRDGNLSHSIDVSLRDASLAAKYRLRYRTAYLPDAR